jgi:phosphatidylinositol 4-kinase
VRKAARQLLAVVQLALRCSPSLPCLCNGDRTIHELSARLHLQGSEQQASQYMRAAVQAATNSFYTRQYDAFQKITNNIL